MNESGMSTTLARADSRRLSTALVDLLARAEDVDPVDLDPLYHTIDPDALDAVCDPDSGFESIEFQYHDYLVTVRAAGTALTIMVEPHRQPSHESGDRQASDSEFLL